MTWGHEHFEEQLVTFFCRNPASATTRSSVVLASTGHTHTHAI